MNTQLILSAVDAATRAVGAWLGSSLVQGTLLAIVTALTLRFALRGARPALKAALWAVVLLKFLVPAGPGLSLSAATLWQRTFAPDAARPMASAIASDEQGQWVLIGGVVADARGTSRSAAAVSAFPWATLWAGLLGAYVLTVAGVLAWRLRGYVRFARACRALPIADGEVRRAVDEICRRVGVRTVRDVRICDEAPAPFVLGFFHPLLVLARRQLDRQVELEAVVLHEVAHLRRGDLYVRHVQWLAGTLLFFWPVVAWVNRRLDLIREAACDEWALRHGRLSTGEYARCLLRALQPAPWRWRPYVPAAMASSVQSVERRIEMILSRDRRSRGRLFAWPAAVLVACWSAFVLGGVSAEANRAEEIKDGKKVETTTTQPQQVEVQVEDVVIDGGEMQWITGDEGIFEIELGDLDMGQLMLDGGDGQFFGTGEFHIVMNVDGLPDAGDGQQRHMVMARAFAPMGMGFQPQIPPDFAANYPAADLNGDGQVSREEFNAFHLALVLKNPAVVLEQFPRADLNKDGVLDATEAARLVMRPPHPPLPPIPPMDVMHGAAPQGVMRVMAMPAVRVAEGKQDEGGDAEESGAQVELKVEVNGDEVKVNGEPVPADGALPAQGARVVMLHRDADGNVTKTVTSGADDRVAHMDMFDKQPQPPADWVRENIQAPVTRADVARQIVVINRVETQDFLARHPKADLNGDGNISEDERKTALEADRAQSEEKSTSARAKALREHPDWDTNHDGMLSNEELRAGLKLSPTPPGRARTAVTTTPDGRTSTVEVVQPGAGAVRVAAPAAPNAPSAPEPK